MPECMSVKACFERLGDLTLPQSVVVVWDGKKSLGSSMHLCLTRGGTRRVATRQSRDGT